MLFEELEDLAVIATAPQVFLKIGAILRVPFFIQVMN
tara:strand:- start:712 stop:822 length:111 start_codon:yes stop_codon:yes gene_type:complete